MYQVGNKVNMPRDSVVEGIEWLEESLPARLEVGSWPNSVAQTIPCDMEELAESYQFRFELDGVHIDDIEVDITDRILYVGASRSISVVSSIGSNEVVTRDEVRLESNLQLPQHANVEGIEAHFDDVNLTITVPKTLHEKSQAKSFKLRDQVEDFLSSWFEVGATTA